jgi:hypothetical protein
MLTETKLRNIIRSIIKEQRGNEVQSIIDNFSRSQKDLPHEESGDPKQVRDNLTKIVSFLNSKNSFVKLEPNSSSRSQLTITYINKDGNEKQSHPDGRQLSRTDKYDVLHYLKRVVKHQVRTERADGSKYLQIVKSQSKDWLEPDESGKDQKIRKWAENIAKFENWMMESGSKYFKVEPHEGGSIKIEFYSPYHSDNKKAYLDLSFFDKRFEHQVGSFKHNFRKL